MAWPPLLPRILLVSVLSLLPIDHARPASHRFPAQPSAMASGAAETMRAVACGAPSLLRLTDAAGVVACADAPSPAARPAIGTARPLAVMPVDNGDGTLLARQRLATIGDVALDLVAYASSGLAVSGLLCFVDDGQPRSTVIHLHGGLGGIFVNPDGGDIVGTCLSWARDHRHTAFVPSFRGQDGGQGVQELCLGEADDVAAGAILLRTLHVVDPDRVALVGGSMGGCVALRAGARIPNLRAVVAIAPPTDWQGFVDFHRFEFVPEVETRCDGSTVDWDIGGPEYADTIDTIICGQPGCSAADYALRTPLQDVPNTTNPTLLLAAGADNLVPVGQQVLWSALRNLYGGTVAVDIRDRCSEVSPLPLDDDVLMYVPGAYHLMEDGPLVSGLIYMLQLLDAPDAPPASAL